MKEGVMLCSQSPLLILGDTCSQDPGHSKEEMKKSGMLASFMFSTKSFTLPLGFLSLAPLWLPSKK